MINQLLKARVIDNLPFSPNFQQSELLDQLTSFLLDTKADSLFLMQGYAGTGKTSLVGALVKTMSELGRKTVLMAPTGRAAKVFSSYSGHPAFTIHKKIYRQKSFSGDMDNFQISDNLHKHTLFIVDEASMIANSSDGAQFGTGRLLDDLIEYVYAGEGCKLLVLGDVAQLPPVGQLSSPALNPEFYKGYGLDVTYFCLTEVARQAHDSGILHNATALREVMAAGEPYGLPAMRTVGFSDVRKVTGTELIDEISNAYSRNGMEETIIITRSNKRANQFNQGIRNQILFREEEISGGDLLLVAKNNYHWCKEIKEIDFIANGDIVQVKRVRGTQEMYGFRFADVEIHFPDYEFETEVKIILDTLHSEAPALPYEMNNRLFQEVYADYAHIPNQRDRIRKVKADPYFNALQVKYAYAITCHKAQGGQWENVFLDMGYINKEHLGLDFYRWLYTAFTRATQKLWLVNIADEFLDEESQKEG
ncbi:MAG: AAA family ATPase [Bacteroidales bacterium]